MSGQAPQVMSRRGHHGRPRSANGSKAKGSDNTSSRAGKDKPVTDKGSEAGTKSETTKASKTKQQNDGEKLVVRRLPPSMPETEFFSILGDEWGSGKGKVDWFSYSEGKVSKDPSKPSRPSRAYIHLVRKDDIMPLSDAVRDRNWEDAKGSFTDPALIAPPTVEFCVYKKVPSGKKRTDTRQGTIDQDPEFMAFLESLANPTQPKDVEAENGETDRADTGITTTPLVEYLKEKKLNKGKDGSSKKNAKSEGGKGKGSSKDDGSSKKKGKGSKEDKNEKIDKPKEAVKILTKQAGADQASADAGSSQASTTGGADAGAPKSRRAGIAAAARLLQRDLGLSPGSAHRKARQDAAKADGDAKSDAKASGSRDSAASPDSSSRPASPAPSDGGKSASQAASKPSGRRNRGGKNADKTKATEGTAGESTSAAPKPPMILKKKQPGADEGNDAAESTGNDGGSSPSKASQQNSSSKGANSRYGQKKPAAAAAPDATRAFVKHANASQGVTEAALREALEPFGAVTMVDLDKRKGFAYVDFADHDGLAKAMSASPVTVGQASVQVLERKDKKPANQAGGGSATNGESSTKPEKGSGRGRRGRGGGKAAGNDKGQAPAATSNGNDAAAG